MNARLHSIIKLKYLLSISRFKQTYTDSTRSKMLRPVALRILGDEDEDDRSVEVEEKEIDGKTYLVGTSTREVFNLGEGYDKVGILSEEGEIISSHQPTKLDVRAATESERTLRGRTLRDERVVLDVSPVVMSKCQLKVGFNTDPVCSEEYLRSCEASWRTFKGVSNARHEQNTENLLMLRDAVERKLYQQAQSNEAWFETQRSDIGKRLREQERGICKFKVVTVESLSEMSKALSKLTERVDALTADAESREELMEEVIQLRQENDKLREEKTELSERLSRAGSAAVDVAKAIAGV